MLCFDIFSAFFLFLCFLFLCFHFLVFYYIYCFICTLFFSIYIRCLSAICLYAIYHMYMVNFGLFANNTTNKKLCNSLLGDWFEEVNLFLDYVPINSKNFFANHVTNVGYAKLHQGKCGRGKLLIKERNYWKKLNLIDLVKELDLALILFLRNNHSLHTLWKS